MDISGLRIGKTISKWNTESILSQDVPKSEGFRGGTP